MFPSTAPVFPAHRPPLTSIERNPQSIAQKSCELILQMMRGESPAETEIYIPTNLVERASTDG